MTTTVTYTYVCDICALPALPEQHFPYTNKDSLAVPRSVMNLGGLDICPECKAKFDDFIAARKLLTAPIPAPKEA